MYLCRALHATYTYSQANCKHAAECQETVHAIYTYTSLGCALPSIIFTPVIIAYSCFPAYSRLHCNAHQETAHAIYTYTSLGCALPSIIFTPVIIHIPAFPHTHACTATHILTHALHCNAHTRASRSHLPAHILRPALMHADACTATQCTP